MCIALIVLKVINAFCEFNVFCFRGSYGFYFRCAHNVLAILIVLCVPIVFSVLIFNRSKVIMFIVLSVFRWAYSDNFHDCNDDYSHE